MKPNSAEWLKYRRDEYEAQRVEMEAEDAASVPPEPPTLSDDEFARLRFHVEAGDYITWREERALCDTVAALRAEVSGLSRRLDSEAVSRATSAARAYAEYTVQDESEAAAIFRACDALLGVGAARSASGEDASPETASEDAARDS